MAENLNKSDDRIYQRRDGTRYVKSEEFANSEQGIKLLKRFTKHVKTDTD